MTKKVKIILIAGFLVLIFAAVGVYLFLISQKPKPQVTDIALTEEERKQLTLSEEEKKRGITLEEKEKKLAAQKRADALKKLYGQKEKKPERKVVSIIKIIDKKVKFPTLSADQKKILYFDPEAREFYQAELDGTNQAAITRGNFSNLKNVSWSQDKSKAILTIFNNETKKDEYFYFDFATQENKKIDSRFENVIVSQDGTKIAYVYTEKDKKIFNLSVADPDGKNWRKIAYLSTNEGKIKWLSDGKVIFIPKGSSSIESALFVYDVVEGKNSFVFVSGKYSFDANFSYDGKWVLWQEGEKREAKPALYVSPLVSGQSGRKLLNGLAEKCAWLYNNVEVLCAVPENFSNYYRQPESWYEDEFVSRDSFYKINVQTGELKKIVEAKQFKSDYDVASPFMTLDGNRMYFIRKNDGKLYALQMP